MARPLGSVVVPVRFASRLMWVLVLVGVVPVVVLGGLSFRANRDALLSTVGGLQVQAAEDLARDCNQLVLGRVDELRQTVEYLPLDTMPSEDVSKVLSIPLRQLGSLNLLALVDARSLATVHTVFTEQDENRQRVTKASLDLFYSRAPVQAALATGAAVGPPYLSPETPGGRVALAVRTRESPPRLLAAELALTELERRVADLAWDGVRAFIVDAHGAAVVHALPQHEAPGPEERALVAEGLLQGKPQVRTVRAADGTEYLAAFAPVPDLGWGVVVARKASEAFAPAERVRRYTLFWALLALLATSVLGIVLARGVSRPVARLAEGVTALAEGRYTQRVPEQGRDELGQLARSFNRMADELQRRETELRTLSEELQHRVDERTRELREAQEQIARTRRLAAIGSLGAGFAHELNNPLTAIMGLLFLANEQVPPDSALSRHLKCSLEQARRMASIIQELRLLTVQEQSSAGRPLDMAQVVRAALEEMREPLEARGITSSCSFAEPLPLVPGHPEQLQKVVAHLLQNALTAMPSGGQLTVELSAVEGGAVCLRVRDTGKGIPEALRERIFDPFFTTKDEPGRVGLGLSVVHRLVDAHHGRILVESAEGQGSTFTVFLPGAGEGAHLV
jgi:signal transduction histidine kinase